MSDRQRAGTPSRQALQPTRDPQVTLPDLLETLLNKGVYLNLDLIITVADIPLIGVNLRATVAGIETMLEYGMMRNWDERTRAWVRKALARHVPLAEDEEVVAKMAGGHQHNDDFYNEWRPGVLYLTTHRLVAYRRDPAEILWQAPLQDIEKVELVAERSVGGEDRTRLHITTTDGNRAVLSAATPERMQELLAQQKVSDGGTSVAVSPPATRLAEGRVWYQEVRAGSPVWRGGNGILDRAEGLMWKGSLDTRPAVRVRPDAIEAVQVEEGHTPLGASAILAVRTETGEVRLAADDAERWMRGLKGIMDETEAASDSQGTDGGTDHGT